MKYFLLFTLFFFISMTSFSQGWYPIGATWYFNQQYQLDWPAHGVRKYTVEKDTIILDRAAKLVSRIIVNWQKDTICNDSLYLYEEGEKVYLWNRNNNEFNIMYDFSLVQGDTIMVKKYFQAEDTTMIIPVAIDSTATVDVDGNDLKVQFISYPSCIRDTVNNYNIFEKIIEHIGSERDFSFPSPDCGETFVYTGLRCYTDSVLFYRNDWWNQYFPEVTCDSIIGSSVFTKKHLSGPRIIIYPNPAADRFYIETKKQVLLTIYNIKGQIVLSGHLKPGTNMIQISFLNNGIYYCKILSEEGISAYKLMKL